MKKIIIGLSCLYLSLLTTGCIFTNVSHKDYVVKEGKFVWRYEDATYGILKCAESYVAAYMIENDGNWKDKDEFICDGEECKNSDNDILEFYGDIPQSGSIIIDSEGRATIKKSLIYDYYICTINSNDYVECTEK